MDSRPKGNQGCCKKDLKQAPNQPHPSLEYPVLFFILKKWPWLHHNIKDFYNLRWRISYPLQKNVPWSPTLRKFRVHLTWGELLILLPFWVAVLAAVFYTFYAPSVTKTGHVARTALIGCFVFAQRNSAITLLFGMPVDRTLFYHKLSARVALIGTVGHAWAFFIDPKYQKGKSSLSAKLATAFENSLHTSGSMMSLMMLGIMLAALPVVRRRLFELFHYIHVTLVFGVVCGALFHTGVLLPIFVLLTWGVDVFLRSVVMARTRYPRNAKLRIMSSTVVELSFPKAQGFDYNPGQYIYVAIPEISWLQWHPFSLSSSPQMKTVTLHIRRSGNWTSALYELAKKKTELSFMCEGPYGSLGVNLFGDRYKMVMLVSGGIGITPMQSLCDQLLFEQVRGRRKLKKLKFIWTDRDPVMMNEAPVVRRSSSIVTPDPVDVEALPDHKAVSGYSFDIFSQILSLVPHGISNEEELEELEDLDKSWDPVMGVEAANMDESKLGDSSLNRRGEQEILPEYDVPSATEKADKNTEAENGQNLYSNELGGIPNKQLNEASVPRRSSSIVMPDPIDVEALSDHETISGYSFDIFSQILALVPPDISSDEELKQLDKSSGLVIKLDDDTLPNGRGQEEIASERTAPKKADENTEADNNQDLWNVNDSKELGEILDMQLYLTGDNGNLVPNMPNAVKGRPNIKDIFIGMKREALSKGERRIAVCVCAPPKLSDLCRKACIVYSDDHVRFDLHTESMEM